MLGRYVMYLEIGRADDDDYDDGESSNEDYYKGIRKLGKTLKNMCKVLAMLWWEKIFSFSIEKR